MSLSRNNEAILEGLLIWCVLVIVSLILPGVGFWLALGVLPFILVRIMIQRRSSQDMEHLVEQYLLRKARRSKRV